MLTGYIDNANRILLTVLSNAEKHNYHGYSKFDGLLSPLTGTLSFNLWPLRLLWTQLIMRSPVNIRPLLFVQKGINPEAPALFARANLDLGFTNQNNIFGARARKCLEWLLNNKSNFKKEELSGNCWGYHHPWQSPGFFQPAGFPNCYLTVICAEALLHGYRVFKEKQLLKEAESAVDFLLTDLPVLHENDSEKCIGYVPKMRTNMKVININALIAAFLVKIACEVSDEKLLKEANKLFQFVINAQTGYGAWYYTTNPEHDLITHDNYHTGMILDALLDYELATGNNRFHDWYKRGYLFYKNNLFLNNGAPKWTSDKEIPHDVHGSAQGILTFSMANDFSAANQVFEWTIKNMYNHNGSFSYQVGGFIPKRFTLLHWCNGWMARGLAVFIKQFSKTKQG